MRPPKWNAVGRRLKYSAAGNTSSIGPTLNLKMPGSALATSVVPSGTPARPPSRKGQTGLKSMDRQIAGSVEVCAIMEQMTTSGTTVERQHVEPDPERHRAAVARPDTKPPASAPNNSNANANMLMVAAPAVRLRSAGSRLLAVAAPGSGELCVQIGGRPVA